MKGFIFNAKNGYLLKQGTFSKILAAKDQNFKEYYTESLFKVLEKTQRDFKNQNNIFSTVNFSIDKEHISQIRKRLNKFLLEIINDFEVQGGDSVADLNIGFHLE